MFTTHYRRLIVRSTLAAALSMALTAPVLAKDRKENSGQGDEAKKALEKQKDIAKALKEKQANSPAELQRQIDDLRTQLDAEKARSAAALAVMQKDMQGFKDSGDKKRIDKTQKAIDKETSTSAAKVADLQRQIDDLQARLDKANADAPPAK